MHYFWFWYWLFLELCKIETYCYYVIGIQVDNDGDEVKDNRFNIINYPGGKYLTTKTKKFSNHQFFEEIVVENGKHTMDSDVTLYMPIK